jgi:hypothetical protein
MERKSTMTTGVTPCKPTRISPRRVALRVALLASLLFCIALMSATRFRQAVPTPAGSPDYRELDRALLAAIREADQLLLRRRVSLPYLGSYPMAFTTMNYISLEHLLPLLADYESRAVADLVRDVASLDDPEARAEVQKLVDMRRRHLQALTALAAANPESASTRR